MLLAQQLRKDLNDLYWKFHAQLPKREGILLRPNSRIFVQYARRKIRRAKLVIQCSSLKKTKPIKRKRGYLARVGIKAERLAKLVSHTHLQLHKYKLLILICILEKLMQANEATNKKHQTSTKAVKHGA